MVLLVEGEITFEKNTPAFTNAKMFVYLEKVTHANAASEVMAYYVRDISFDPKTKNVLTFVLDGKPSDPREAYAVRVHIDLDGDGKISPGDFINMQNYPVLTFGHPRKVSIHVRQVM